jgi:5-methylcytosine-specific restriction endonuclease McrA
MSRSEFKASVRQRAWERCKGLCEKCTAKLFPGHFDYDHIIPDGLGGEPTLENCQVLCDNCHEEKTHKHDRPIMQKADNIRKKHLGQKPKRPWSQFKKKMNGQVVKR